MKEVFPKDMCEHSAHLYFLRFNAAGRTVYYLLLTAFISAFLSLPFIEIDIYQTARGIIRPISASHLISSLNSGKVIYSRLQFNSRVKKGDTLLIIENHGLDEELQACRSQLHEIQMQINDLELLLESSSIANPLILQTDKYRSAYLEFLTIQGQIQTRKVHDLVNLDRNFYLYEKGVISVAEYEELLLKQRLINSELEVFRQGQRAHWHSERVKLHEKIQALIAKEKQLEVIFGQHIITAHINGILINVKPQHESSFVNAGTNLAEISPDTMLVAECFVPPKDIALIRVAKKVSFQLDTYDYNQWGILKGSIMEVGQDMEIVDGKPMFKVRCLIEKQFLELRSGLRGKITKGMTLTAQFQIAKRSLWHLLYDKTDQWLDPGQTRKIT